MKFNKVILATVLALSFAGAAYAAHSVGLSWTASIDMPATIPSGSGYNVYRSSGACPASGLPTSPVLLNSAPVTAVVYTDSTVTPGAYCYYVVTALNGAVSAGSNTAQGAVPVAPPTNVIINNQQ